MCLNRLLAMGIVGGLAALWGSSISAEEKPPTKLTKLPFAFPKAMENTPIIYDGRPLILLNHRDDTKVNTDKYKDSMYLYLVDLQTGDRLAQFGEGHSFVTGFVDGKRLHVFASEGSNFDWFQSLYHFWSDDLKTWQRELAIERKGSEHLFNCSICRDPAGYVMAYESNEPVAFCFRFARSRELSKWEPVKELLFAGQTKEYSACPMIRYVTVLLRHLPARSPRGT